MADNDDGSDAASGSEPTRADGADSAPLPDRDRPDIRSRRGAFDSRTLTSVAATTVIAALTAATAILAVEHRDAAREQADRSAFLQAARQAVVDLTTISADSADADIARILDASTGEFHEDFTSRSAAFTTVVKQAHVSTAGTVGEAGVESLTGDEAKVLVAATSKVTNTAGAHNEPRVWRLRLTLRRTEGRILVSNVDFVP